MDDLPYSAQYVHDWMQAHRKKHSTQDSLVEDFTEAHFGSKRPKGLSKHMRDIFIFLPPVEWDLDNL